MIVICHCHTAHRFGSVGVLLLLMATQIYCYGFAKQFPLCSNNLSQALGRTRNATTNLRHFHVDKNKKRVGGKLVIRAGDLLGDFGARDPTPAEIESNFGDKVLGEFGTEHKILIPSTPALSLADRTCKPIPPGQPPMSKEEASKLLKKVVGWRIAEGDGGMRLECLWKVKSFSAGMELFKRIALVAEEAEHHPDLHLEGSKSVRAQIWTRSIGGLSVNDFIVAAKIDGIKISDLIPRKRVWA